MWAFNLSSPTTTKSTWQNTPSKLSRTGSLAPFAPQIYTSPSNCGETYTPGSRFNQPLAQIAHQAERVRVWSSQGPLGLEPLSYGSPWNQNNYFWRLRYKRDLGTTRPWCLDTWPIKGPLQMPPVLCPWDKRIQSFGLCWFVPPTLHGPQVFTGVICEGALWWAPN